LVILLDAEKKAKVALILQKAEQIHENVEKKFHRAPQPAKTTVFQQITHNSPQSASLNLAAASRPGRLLSAKKQ
jgi:hypothetical protein